jgi:divalent metal cation (Fe/Co/Zn/Cd) transporter
MALVLALSIGVKLWMSVFYGKLGERIDSAALKASSQDSRNDVLSTGISLAAMLLSMTPVSFPFDGAAGVVISVFILKSGWEIANEIVSQLLGKPAERELTDHIREQILSHPEILGVHDMIIHDYGPGVQIGSAHAEVDSEMTLVAAHDALDAAEEEIMKLYNVTMTLHADPVDVRDERANRYKETFEEVLKGIDDGLTLHDFRLRRKGECEEAAFDVLIPYGCPLAQNEIDISLKEACGVLGCNLSVTYDHDFTMEAGE